MKLAHLALCIGDLRRCHAHSHCSTILECLIEPFLILSRVVRDGKAQPLVGPHVVGRRDALAEAVHESDIVLRPRIALLGGAQIPVRRRGMVARHALAAPVHRAKQGLGLGVALLGERPPDGDRRREILALVGAGRALQVLLERLRADRPCKKEKDGKNPRPPHDPAMVLRSCGEVTVIELEGMSFSRSPCSTSTSRATGSPRRPIPDSISRATRAPSSVAASTCALSKVMATRAPRTASTHRAI